MNVLIISATEAEIRPLLDSRSEWPSAVHIDVLITGVGMVAAAVQTASYLATHQIDAVLHVGIAGTFNVEDALGDVVVISEDGFPELGAEDGEQFIPLSRLPIENNKDLTPDGPVIPDVIPFMDRVQHLSAVRGITVNKVHGSEVSIKAVQERWPADVETMESAAVIYACNAADVPCLGLRGISNRVEKRNREAWDIELAVKNVNRETLDLIRGLV
ncbi:MAG: futalosine hydrolase [Flavobacteriales bacterium]|nr:futalosine hydrolase [Flavobacteriales bacterium]